MNSVTKNFDILIKLCILYHFDNSTKFSDLYLTKFLDILEKLFFPCSHDMINI